MQPSAKRGVPLFVNAFGRCTPFCQMRFYYIAAQYKYCIGVRTVYINRMVLRYRFASTLNESIRLK